MSYSGRRAVAAIATLLASIAMVLALVSVHFDKVLVNKHGFTSHATTVWESNQVQKLVVNRVTDAVVPSSGLLSVAQPVVQRAVGVITASKPVKAAVRTAAEELQPQLVSGNANQLTLSLPVGAELAPELRSVNGTLADLVRQVGNVRIFSVQFPSAAATTMHAAATFGSDATIFVIIAVGLIAVALVISPERFRTLMRLGFGAMIGGLLVVAAYFVLRALSLAQLSGDAETVVRVVWNTYLGGLVIPALVMAGIGAGVGSVAAVLGSRSQGYR